MPTSKEYQEFYDKIAALQEKMTDRLAAQVVQNPQLVDVLVGKIDSMLTSAQEADARIVPPPDSGLAQLAGIGPEAATSFGETRMAVGVQPYDETVVSERIIAVGDLYYLYQHEKIGVWRVVQKLQDLFRSGTARLSSGPGAYALYQFDRREVLRYTNRDRHSAYRRALGYGAAPLGTGAQANTDFHPLLLHFVNQVALFWRDKRISDVIRERAFDPSFGSIAVVRRSGLDLRNNLKFTSFGHVNVMRVEVMQLLEEAFKILNSDDIKRLHGSETAWDVIEDVLVRYFNERLVTSPRQRMAVAGREILRWLAQPHILQTSRAEFEALLRQVADYAEEWLTSAQALGLGQRRNAKGVLPWDRQRPLSTTSSMAG